MNDDLISRSALKQALDWIINNPYVDADREIMEEINNAPTVEQEYYITGAQWDEFMKEHKRPRGEWITDERGYVCSECGALHGDDYPFCHMCGAEMRGGKE